VARVNPVRRTIGVSSPLGDGVFSLQTMHAREELGRLFGLDLELQSENSTIDLDQVIGQPMTLRLPVDGGHTRYWHGIVSEFAQLTQASRTSVYRATVRPWFWWLTRTADCRVFQDLTVPQIVESLFGEQGFSDYTLRLSGSYRTWPYCVQYRETDFDFLSRLLEQEGIYYYFVHEADRHTLVLADGPTSHDLTQSYQKVTYLSDARGTGATRDHVYRWLSRRSIQSGSYALRDFDFEHPQDSLDVRRAISGGRAGADSEVFDYPGEYRDLGDGQHYANVRLQELQNRYERVEGGATARGLAVGSAFYLRGFPRDDQNRQYLVVATTTRLEATGRGVGRELTPSFDVEFDALPAETPFRPARTTRRPRLAGPQTAVVTGPSGEEIWTDEYGRVKVRFHWDRHGSADEHSSCWLRVSQAWAGRDRGTLMIPRVGDEVIVEFLEGDPDRPIVTGRVYNARNLPPYELPADQTVSGIRTRSSPGGGPPPNEIRFEDKQGSEELLVRAARDLVTEVENDSSTSIAHDEFLGVGNDRTTTVGASHSETVGASQTIQVGSNRTETIGADLTLTVAGDQAVAVQAGRSVTVGGDRSETTGAACEVSVGLDLNETIGKSRVVQVGQDHVEEAEKSRTLTAKSIRIEAGDEITLKTGKAQITMKKNGDISIRGKRIDIKGSGKVVIKGTKVIEN
jgi:type VI secretion system secreted protein VgrG